MIKTIRNNIVRVCIAITIALTGLLVSVSHSSKVSAQANAPWMLTHGASMFVNQTISWSTDSNATFTTPQTNEQVTLSLNTEGAVYSAFSGGNNFSRFGNFDGNYALDEFFSYAESNIYESIQANIEQSDSISINESGSLNFPAGSSVAQVLGASKRDYVITKVDGVAFFEENVTCDLKAIFLIPANENKDTGLRIERGLKNETLGDACMFVVEDDTTIASTPETNDSVEIHAALISDNSTNFLNEGGTGPVQISGLVNSKSVTSNIPGINQDTPTILIEYDPRYKLYFGDIFAPKVYSVREYAL